MWLFLRFIFPFETECQMVFSFLCDSLRYAEVQLLSPSEGFLFPDKIFFTTDIWTVIVVCECKRVCITLKLYFENSSADLINVESMPNSSMLNLKQIFIAGKISRNQQIKNKINQFIYLFIVSDSCSKFFLDFFASISRHEMTTVNVIRSSDMCPAHVRFFYAKMHTQQRI